MRNAGLGSWPERRLRISPQRPAIWFEGTTTTHGEFAHRVRRAAAALEGLGVRRGDRVAWFGANHPTALELLYACGQLGAIWVPVNARLTAPEARYVLEHSGASLVVHGREHGTTADTLRAELPAVRHWVAAETPLAGGADSLDWGQLLADAEPVLRDEPVTDDDPCLIMYTSGTTGRPKGAVLTHGNMTWSCINQAFGLDFTPDERTLGLAPLFHIGGLNGTVNPTLLRGGSVVLVRGFDPPATLAVISEQRVTSFFAVPTMLDALSRQPDFDTIDLSALRTIGAAGAPLPLPLLRTWLDRGITVQQAYGMTESAPAGTMLDSADAVAKVGSAGKSQFFVDVRVVRPDGTECGPGEIGEVVLSGPNIMAGYWNAPEETAAAIVDGWYHSGDAGSTDEDGYLYIRDRYKDMIISGGENVYPAEIESALLEFDDVQEVAVIGVPDPTWGEVGLAVVVPAPGTALDGEELRTRLRTRLAGFKVPKHVELADELPKTATGKIRKPDLRDRYVTTEETPSMSTTTTVAELPSLKGQELGTSSWVDVTQERVNQFAEATGDHQWIHVDVERANAESPFGGPIAHGYLTLSLIIPMYSEVLTVTDAKMGVNYGLNKVRFPAPVPVGAKVRLTATLKDVEEVAGGLQVTIAGVIEAEGADKPVCIAEPVFRVYG